MRTDLAIAMMLAAAFNPALMGGRRSDPAPVGRSAKTDEEQRVAKFKAQEKRERRAAKRLAAMRAGGGV